jgi:hypothetical protein
MAMNNEQHGINTSTPFGEFKSKTYNENISSLHRQFDTFPSCYDVPQNILQNPSTINKGALIHNNIHQQIQTENIVEYRLYIDSSDRDATLYSNPFKFSIIFAPVHAGYIKSEGWIDPSNKSLGKVIKNTYITGSTEPYINRSFKNVKFIRIESILIPRFNKVIYDTQTDTYSLNTTTTVSSHRFLILKIKEILPNSNIYGTNTHLENGIIIFPTVCMNQYYFMGNTAWNKTYQMSTLGNINKLSFELCSDTGEPIEFTIEDETGKPLQPDLDKLNKSNVNNAFHSYFQLFITVALGIMENNINTMVKY